MKVCSRAFLYDYLEWMLGTIPWIIVSALAAVCLGTHNSVPSFLIDTNVPSSWTHALMRNVYVWLPSVCVAWLVSRAAAGSKFAPGQPPASLIFAEVQRAQSPLVVVRTPLS